VVVSWESVMVGLKGCRDLSFRGRDQRLEKNRLVSNGDQFLVTTLDVQVTFGQNDDVGDDVG
jgi:hypothetical protein